jgi:O-antigen ligase
MIKMQSTSLLLDLKNTWSWKDYIFFFNVLLLFSATFLPQKVTSTILIASVVILLFTGRITAVWQGIKSSRIFHILLLYVFIFLVSALTSDNFGEGIKQLEKKVPLLLCPLIFFSPILNERIRQILLRAFILSWSFAALFAIFKTITIYNFESRDASLFFYVLPSAIFDMGANYFGLMISFCFIITMIGVGEGKMKRTFVNYLLIAFLFLFLAMLSSRTAFFSAIFICIVYAIYKGAVNRQSRIVIMGLTAVFVLSAVVAVRTVPYLRNRIAAIRLDERPAMIKVGWEIARSNIMFGIGIGDVSDELQKKFLTKGYTHLIRYNHIHNDFLHHLMAIGLIGLVIYFVMLGFFFQRAFHYRDAMAIAFLVLYVLASQTEVLSTRHLGLLFFSMMFSLFFIHSNEKDPAR